MKVDLNSIISITEANQNFSKVAKMVDENGVAVILKNNKPRYIIVEYSQFEEQDGEDVLSVAEKLLKKHIKAFKELAK